MQAGIPRARDRAPPATMAEDEDHMIDVILRLKTQQQRRIAVLFEDHGDDECSLQTVCFAALHHLPERSEGFPLPLPVILQRVEESLNLLWSSMGADDIRFFACERLSRRSSDLDHAPWYSQRRDPMPFLLAEEAPVIRSRIPSLESLSPCPGGNRMPTREPTFATPQEEREYLGRVQDELNASQTKDDVVRVWRAHYLKIGHRKLGRLLIGRPIDEILKSRG